MRTDGLQTVAPPVWLAVPYRVQASARRRARLRTIALLLTLPTMGQGLLDADAGLSTPIGDSLSDLGAGG